MVVRNGMSRYHLASEALRRARLLVAGSDRLVSHCEQMLDEHSRYVVEHMEDLPEVRGLALVPLMEPAQPVRGGGDGR